VGTLGADGAEELDVPLRIKVVRATRRRPAGAHLGQPLDPDRRADPPGFAAEARVEEAAGASPWGLKVAWVVTGGSKRVTYAS
jgi:hypothetical protein